MPPDPETPKESEREETHPQERKPLPDDAAKPEEDAEAPDVRVAGRKQMDLPPEEWDEVDEEVDESFPASDPPGNY